MTPTCQTLEDVLTVKYTDNIWIKADETICSKCGGSNIDSAKWTDIHLKFEKENDIISEKNQKSNMPYPEVRKMVKDDCNIATTLNKSLWSVIWTIQL